jgi:hypothetical protein
MEHLIIDLKQHLTLKRMKEMKKIQEFNQETDKDIILISSGKIIELDLLIKSLEEMINYINKTRNIRE